MAVIAAFYLNLVLPQMTASFSYAQNDAAISSIPILLKDWAANMTKMVALIFLIIYILMFIQQIIQIHHLMPRLSRSLRPLMKVFGLPEDAAYLWLVGNILGISYGGAVMMDMLEKKLITKEQANDVNYHLIMNHSLLEDTSIFAAIGISAFWIVSSRLIFALIVVWGRKLILHMRTHFLATCHHH
jgi:spore maturation protein SpmB